MVERIGRFEIQERSGETAVGRIYRALDPSLGRPVTVKTVRFAPGLTEDARDAIMREARLVGTLSHPNVATVYDAGLEDDYAYLASEHVDGQPLAGLIAEAAPFRPSAILPWLDQIADALDYAHRRGVVHRDITPAEILLTRLGQIKIADFGLARMAMAADGGRNTPLGNPSYMAPEQVRGEPADARSDVYSLGVVIFELLSGKRPFDGGTLVSTVYKVVNQTPPKASELVAGLDPKVDQVLDRALEKDSAARFASARELVEALRAVAQTASLPAPAPSADAPSGPARFCDQCGTGLRANVKFCYRCGAETMPPEAVEVPDGGAPSPETYVMASDRTRDVAGLQALPTLASGPAPGPGAPTAATGGAGRHFVDADTDELDAGAAPAAQPSTVRLEDAPAVRSTQRVGGSSGRTTTSLPLAGYAASTGTAELPPPGAEVDTPPSRMSTVSGLLLPMVAVVLVIALAGVGGYMVAPRLFGGKRVPASEAPKPAEPEAAQPEGQPTAADPAQPPGPFGAAVVAPETKNALEPELAAGAPDGKFARVAPNGMVTVAFPQGLVLRDDGTDKPEVKVSGAGDNVFFIVAVRRPDGDYQVIDRVNRFGASDMHHHKVAETDAVKIINRGSTELLVDAIEAVRPLEAR